jgi:hypothetical protein
MTNTETDMARPHQPGQAAFKPILPECQLSLGPVSRLLRMTGVGRVLASAP